MYIIGLYKFVCCLIIGELLVDQSWCWFSLRRMTISEGIHLVYWSRESGWQLVWTTERSLRFFCKRPTSRTEDYVATANQKSAVPDL